MFIDLNLDIDKNILIEGFTYLKEEYFYDIVEPVYNILKSKSEPITHIYTIASKNIKINFYGRTVYEKLNISISHNKTDNSKDTDFIINIWDSVSNDVSFLSPWTDKKYIYEKKIQKNLNDNLLGVYTVGEKSLSFYNKNKKEANFWINDANLIPDWIKASPVRTILNIFFDELNIHLVHGASVGIGNNSVLLTAKGGSGKSTTALSCLLSGMNYLGDDYCAMETVDNSVYCHNLYDSGKITHDTLVKFPEFKDLVSNKTDYDQKLVVLTSDICPESLIKKSRIRAVLIPRIKNLDKTIIVPTTKIQALAAILPTTLFQLPYTESSRVNYLKEAIKLLPCYFIELGSNIREVPLVIQEFLKNNFDE